MRFPIPPKKVRIRVNGLLERFFAAHDEKVFRQAMRLLARFYKLPMPKVDWYVTLGRDTAGETLESGKIRLVHPSDWKTRKSRYRTPERWVEVALHEFGHYVFYSDAEAKACQFERRLRAC